MRGEQFPEKSLCLFFLQAELGEKFMIDNNTNNKN